MRGCHARENPEPVRRHRQVSTAGERSGEQLAPENRKCHQDHGEAEKKKSDKACYHGDKMPDRVSGKALAQRGIFRRRTVWESQSVAVMDSIGGDWSECDLEEHRTRDVASAARANLVRKARMSLSANVTNTSVDATKPTSSDSVVMAFPDHG